MFKYLLLITAFLIAISAGFFSITGIGHLFVGATVSAMIMATGLELGKLVSISFLFRFWKKIGMGMRSYFIAAAIVLMVITSTGVYGYLSAAYAVSASSIKAAENQITLLESQKTSLNQSIQRLIDRAQTLQNVRIQQENRLDKLVGQRGLSEQQRAVTSNDKVANDLQTQISKIQLQRDSIDAQQTMVRNDITRTGKLGTFYYVAQSFNIPLDTIVHWFILAIVFVFDPLSISLLVAYQFVDREERNIIDIPKSNIILPLSTIQPEWVPPPFIDDTDKQRQRDGIKGERSS